MAAKYTGSDFLERFGSWAVIAGGSDGIGAAFAHGLAKRGLNLVLVGRRAEILEAKAEELRSLHATRVLPVQADLSEIGMLEVIAKATEPLDVGLLVYNAGSSRTNDKFTDSSQEQLMYMEHLNCQGPLLLSHHFAQQLRARGRGGIVLMSSLACLAGSAYQATYCATKAFNTILAEGLWHELAPEGVDVVGVMAGVTRTETMLHSGEAFDTAMDPAEVAEGALDHLGKGPTFVPGDINRAAVKGMWPLPRVALINGMSRACSDLFDLPHQAVEGSEFHEV